MQYSDYITQPQNNIHPTNSRSAAYFPTVHSYKIQHGIYTVHYAFQENMAVSRYHSNTMQHVQKHYTFYFYFFQHPH